MKVISQHKYQSAVKLTNIILYFVYTLNIFFFAFLYFYNYSDALHINIYKYSET